VSTVYANVLFVNELNVCLPVKRNCQQVCDAGRAGHDVGGDPEFAEVTAEAPGPGNVVDQGKWHHDGRNQEI